MKFFKKSPKIELIQAKIDALVARIKAKKPDGFKRFIYAVVACFFVGYFGVSPAVKLFMPGDVQELARLRAEMQTIKGREVAEQALGNYTLNMIARTRNKSRFSAAKKQIIARAVVRVASDLFSTIEEQHAIVAVFAIESEFDRTARSGGSIAGIGQTTRASFHEGLKACGLPDASDTDITELELGLYASACYYKGLLVANNNDTYMALVAYNQGLYSQSAKTYSANGTLDNTEVLKYISRFTYLTRNVTDKKDMKKDKAAPHD
jgi:predicted NodU family carbamoyl transferase